MTSSRSPARDDIAVIGMSCVFAGAPDLTTFWNNILAKACFVEEAPDDWAVPLFDPASSDSTRIYTRRVGRLGDAATFDPLLYGTPPNAVSAGEPDQFLALREASEALRDGGYIDRSFNRETTGIILGRGATPNPAGTNAVMLGMAVDQFMGLTQKFFPDANGELLDRIRAELQKSLEPFSAESGPGLVSNVAAGRIANRLDLMGPSFLIDAACASSLIAVDLAISELRSGRCDMMLAGGVQASMPPLVYILFCHLNALSRGAILPFDASADGTLLGEGAGFLLLKRLVDAARDEDRIYAVIKGVGTASSGRAIGLLAPGVAGERLAIQRAYADSGIDPKSVELIEAHATGIRLGDAAEIEAMRSVFGERTRPLPSCAIGSVKSMIGHAIPASGVASMIKTILAIHHKILPPTLCEVVNPDLGLDHTPFYVNTEPRPWIHSDRTRPRRAGVSAFGFGGINSHAILEEYRGENRKDQCLHWRTELAAFSASDPSALLRELESVQGFIDAYPGVPLADVAHSLLERPTRECRLAIVARDVGDLSKKIAKAREKIGEGKRERYKTPSGTYFCADASRHADDRTAFLFPGQGSQYQGMLGDLYPIFPEVRRWYDLSDAAFDGEWKYLPSEYVFPPPTGLDDALRERLAGKLYDIDVSTEMIFTAGMAMFDLLTAFGIEPDVMLGHSAGEYTSLTASGAFEVTSAEDHILAKRKLNRFHRDTLANSDLPRGLLLTVGGVEPEVLDTVLRDSRGGLQLAMDNCPNQKILFGDAEAIQKAAEIFRSRGGVCSELPYGYAYHTPLFENMRDPLTRCYDGLPFKTPKYPVYSCASCGRFPDGARELKDLAVGQWSTTVRFRETIEMLHGEGIRNFVEVGPSSVLKNFVDDILRGKEHLAVASNERTRPGLEQLQCLLAQLFVNGKSLDLGLLYRDRAVSRVAFDEPRPDETPSPTLRPLGLLMPRLGLSDEFVNSIRPELSGAEGSAGQATGAVAVGAAPAAAQRPVGNAEALSELMERHHELMREFLESQRRSAAVFFGSEPEPESETESR